MKPENPLTRGETRDLQTTFPLYKELFDFVEKQGFDEMSLDCYRGDIQSENYRPVALPEKFQSLVQDYPGNYFIVGSENRQDPRNRAGSRYKKVRLSTVKIKMASDIKIREIDIILADPSLGNVVDIIVTDSVNNQSFEKVNDVADTETESPYGLVRITNRIDTAGNKETVALKFNRLDEGLFNFGDKVKAVRWVRNLDIEKTGASTQELVYHDFYIVGRSKNIGQEERADIKTQIKTVAGKPKTISVKIGFGDFDTGRVLFEDKETGIRVCDTDFNNEPKQMEILKQDPAYTLLFQTPAKPQEFIEALMARVAMLQNDWDKPQTVYGSTPNLEQAKPAITELK